MAGKPGVAASAGTVTVACRYHSHSQTSCFHPSPAAGGKGNGDSQHAPLASNDRPTLPRRSDRSAVKIKTEVIN